MSKMNYVIGNCLIQKIITMNNLKLEFTNCNRTLKNYFDLRSKLYKRDLGFTVPIDQFDVKGQHLIIKQDDIIVGGARLASRFPGDLPMEENGFILESHSDLSMFDNWEIGEIGRISILEEIRSIPLLKSVFEKLYVKCHELGIKIIFTIAPRHIARMTAIMCHSLGYRVDIKRHIPMAEHSLYTELGEMNLVIIK